MISPIDKLLAIEEIKQLKARYFRFVDSHDWAEVLSVLQSRSIEDLRSFGVGLRRP